MPRQQGDAFYQNLKIVKEVEELAQRKGVTAAQIAIAWVMTLSKREDTPVVIPIPGASSEARVKENVNASKIKFSREEWDQINDLLNKNTVVGGRYSQ